MFSTAEANLAWLRVRECVSANSAQIWLSDESRTQKTGGRRNGSAVEGAGNPYSRGRIAKQAIISENKVFPLVIKGASGDKSTLFARLGYFKGN